MNKSTPLANNKIINAHSGSLSFLYTKAAKALFI